MRVSLSLILIFLVSCSHHQVRIVGSTPDRPRVAHEAEAQNFMVTTQGGATTRAALSVLNQGGNIIDAFVAASFAISVERPHSTGIGGGGFLMFFEKSSGKVYAFDFRETAPNRSRSDMYLNKSGEPQTKLSQDGSLAVAVPGLVRGLWDIHQRFGKLAWNECVAPAISLARYGLPLYPQLQEALIDRKDVLLQDKEAKATFFTKEGKVPLLGELIYQENLAKTLETIALKGAKGFYEGSVAKSIVKSIKDKKGIMTLRDLVEYKMKERQPVSGNYKGLKVYSMPPPSSGGIHVIQILKMLEPHNLKTLKPQTVESVHLTANAMQRAFLDRAMYLGDPDFNEVPVKELLNEKYISEMSHQINTERAIPADDLRPNPLPYESSETTHFTIADKEGNLVASTQTINGWFGSGMMAQGTGIMLNNEMDDFAQKVGAQNLFGAVGGKFNLVEPKKRPLSSMSPTILTKEGNPFMALGSPSGTRIITCVAQTILNSVEYEMPLYEAVAATRIHQQWRPDVLRIETPHLSKEVEKELSKKGHNISHEGLGCSIQAIKKEDKGWVGVSDPRGEGLARGI